MAGAMTAPDLITGSFTIGTRFGESPKIFFGEVSGAAYYHIPMHGGVGLDHAKSDFQVNALLRTWSAFYLLGVTEVLGGATAG